MKSRFSFYSPEGLRVTVIVNLSHRNAIRICGIVIFSIAVGWITGVTYGQTASALGRTIEVPLDHKSPSSGRGSLYFEFGAVYDRTKPTVFIIADAQQFYFRHDQIARL